MKMFTIAAVAALITATSVSAGTFAGATSDPIVAAPMQVAQPRNFELTFGANHVTGIEGATLAYRFADFNIGAVRNELRAFVGYARLTEEAAAGLEYTATVDVATRLAAYGAVTATYVAPTNDLRNGDVTVVPAIGMTYALSDRIGAFSEVGYGWNATNSWARVGGFVEAGVDVRLTEGFSVRPSVVRTFDTPANQTTARIEAVVRF